MVENSYQTSALNAEQLKEYVTQLHKVSVDVHVLNSVDSTNIWSIQHCKNQSAHQFACFAEEQTNGKGRRGKHWVMAPRANIALSLCWAFSATSSLNLLPLTVAMVIVKTLDDVGVSGAKIKWPNDVYVNDRKIAGILIETVPNIARDKLTVIIGLGLNFDMSSMAEHEELTMHTDILSQLAEGQEPKASLRAEIAQYLLAELVNVCRDYLQVSSTVLDDFRKGYDYCQSKTVDILLNDGNTLTGVSQGVDDNAELLVLVDGEVMRFNSAEVSVRAQLT